MTTPDKIKAALKSFGIDRNVPINQKPSYKAVQERLLGNKEKECECPVSLRKKGRCKKCKKKLRE